MYKYGPFLHSSYTPGEGASLLYSHSCKQEYHISVDVKAATSITAMGLSLGIMHGEGSLSFSVKFDDTGPKMYLSEGKYKESSEMLFESDAFCETSANGIYTFHIILESEAL